MSLRVLQKFYSESRAYWFNRWAGECLSDFKLLGLIVGLAIYNFVLLDFPLPIALYRKMCSQHVNLSDLTWFQPTVGKYAFHRSFDLIGLMSRTMSSSVEFVESFLVYYSPACFIPQ